MNELNQRVVRFLTSQGYEEHYGETMRKFLPADYEIIKYDSYLDRFDPNRPCSLVFTPKVVDTRKFLYFGIDRDTGKYGCTVLYPIELCDRYSFHVESFSFRELLLDAYKQAVAIGAGSIRHKWFESGREYYLVSDEIASLMLALMEDLDGDGEEQEKGR